MLRILIALISNTRATSSSSDLFKAPTGSELADEQPRLRHEVYGLMFAPFSKWLFDNGDSPRILRRWVIRYHSSQWQPRKKSEVPLAGRERASWIFERRHVRCQFTAKARVCTFKLQAPSPLAPPSAHRRPPRRGFFLQLSFPKAVLSPSLLKDLYSSSRRPDK